jgi:hypothetical protein
VRSGAGPDLFFLGVLCVLFGETLMLGGTRAAFDPTFIGWQAVVIDKGSEFICQRKRLSW